MLHVTFLGLFQPYYRVGQWLWLLSLQKRLADCSRGGSSNKDAPVINNLSEKATSQKSYHLITILAWGFIQLCS